MQAQQDYAKAVLHNQLVVLTAPRDAIVLSVAKISVGSVVTSAEPLIQLVPIDAPLSVEADISGIDSGYVSPGDVVRIKFDTLPFLQYGTASGVVRTISADSFSPEDTPQEGGSTLPNRPRTLYYRADISLDESMLHDTPPGFPPMPGMPLTADVKVGTRSVLAYFIDKILPVAYDACTSPEPDPMDGMNLLAKPLDRFASLSPKRARARAERLSEAAPERALALFAAAAEAGDTEAAFIVGERYLEGKGTLRPPVRGGALVPSRRRGRSYACAVPPCPAPSRRPAAGRDWAERGAIRVRSRRTAPTITRRRRGRGARLRRVRRRLRPCSPIFFLPDRKNCAIPTRRSSGTANPPNRIARKAGSATSSRLMQRADTAEKTFAARDELVSGGRSRIAHGVLPARFGRRARDRHGARRGRGAAALQDGGRGWARQRAGQARPVAARRPRRTGRPAERRKLAAPRCSWRRLRGGGARSATSMSAGRPLPPNYAEAAHWFRSAAERGHQAAARALGMLYLTGAGVARDPDEAASWFRRAAEAGDPRAQADLAVLLQTGAVSTLAHEPPPVHEWFERAAEQGDLIGAFNYAVCLAEGVGVPRNDERAAFWLKRAAEGVVNAQYWYGRMLAEGRGVAKNDAEAAAWFARAAEAGMAEAQVALAELHVNGRGVPRDHQLAKSWFLRATPAGHAGAMFALGALHGGGHDIETDREEARRWFAEAAEHGHPIAALMLARYTMRGLGGPQDIEAGRRWYARAASLGSPEVADELDALERALAMEAGTRAGTEAALEAVAQPYTDPAAKD